VVARLAVRSAEIGPPRHAAPTTQTRTAAHRAASSDLLRHSRAIKTWIEAPAVSDVILGIKCQTTGGRPTGPLPAHRRGSRDGLVRAVAPSVCLRAPLATTRA
jgi:hypothetical protein